MLLPGGDCTAGRAQVKLFCFSFLLQVKYHGHNSEVYIHAIYTAWRWSYIHVDDLHTMSCWCPTSHAYLTVVSIFGIWLHPKFVNSCWKWKPPFPHFFCFPQIWSCFAFCLNSSLRRCEIWKYLDHKFISDLRALPFEALTSYFIFG